MKPPVSKRLRCSTQFPLVPLIIYMVSEPRSNPITTMASSSSVHNPLVGVAISEKLSQTNHAMWREQVLVAVRGSRLVGHLIGDLPAPLIEIDTKVDNKDVKVPNLAYEWYAKDQQVLSFFLGSLGRDVLGQVVMKETVAPAWAAIETMFSSKTRAHALNTRLALAAAQKGNQFVTDHIGKMWTLGDEMDATGRPLNDDELVDYIITGLNMDFNPIISALVARMESVSVSELFNQLLAFETRMELLGGGNSGSSVNAANRGRDNGGVRNCCGFGGSGRGRGDGRGRGNDNNTSYTSCQGSSSGRNNNHTNNGSSPREKITCQVCFKVGHTANRC